MITELMWMDKKSVCGVNRTQVSTTNIMRREYLRSAWHVANRQGDHETNNTVTHLQARSSVRHQGNPNCMYNCMSLQYSGKWRHYGNRGSLLHIHQYLKKTSLSLVNTNNPYSNQPINDIHLGQIKNKVISD